MEIVEIGHHNCSLWDELVKNSPDGTIFHSYQWLEACSRMTGRELVTYLCMHNGKPVGGCSLYVSGSKIYRRASSNIELAPYGGLLLTPSPGNSLRDRQSYNNNIIRLIIDRIEQNHFADVRLVNVPTIADMRPFTWAGWSVSTMYAFYLALDGNIHDKVSKSMLRIVNKAIKNNITIKKEYDPDLLYRLYVMTFSRQHLSPPVSRQYLKTLMDMVIADGSGEMWIARLPSGEAIAAETIIMDDKRAYRWVPAADPEFRDYGATPLLLYEIFKDLAIKGYEDINLMGANMPKIAEFVAGFNPRLVPYYAVRRTKKSVLIGTQVITAIKSSIRI